VINQSQFTISVALTVSQDGVLHNCAKGEIEAILLNKLNCFTFVVVGVVVVVEVLVDVLVEEVEVAASVVDVDETTTSECIVGASESVIELALLDVGAASGVTTSAGAATVAAGVGAAAEIECGRVSALLKAAVGRIETARVTLTVSRLVTALQRRPPQHRMIQKRTFCSPAHTFFRDASNIL
jgi:hypothetical protein